MIDSPTHRQLALRTARESIVLLTNRDNLLPLDKNSIKTIAVIGPHADSPMTGIGLYGAGVEVRQAARRHSRTESAPASQVLYARGSGILESDDPEASYAEAEANRQDSADVAVLFVGTDQLLEGEGRDRVYINLPPVQQQLVNRVAAANPKTVVVLLNGGPVSLGGGGRGGRGGRGAAQGGRAGARGGARGGRGGAVEIPAVLEMFFAGEEGGNAIADVLFGNYNPGGKLPYTVYQSAGMFRPRMSTTSPKASPICISRAGRSGPSGMA